MVSDHSPILKLFFKKVRKKVEPLIARVNYRCCDKNEDLVRFCLVGLFDDISGSF